MQQNRITHLRQIMKDAQVDGFLVSSASNIFYLSGFNRFLQDHDGFLLVTQKSVFLITSPLYTEAVKKFTPDLAILETTADEWHALKVKQIAIEEHIEKIGFEERDLRVAEFFDLEHEKVLLQSVSLRNLRSVKQEEEIVAIQKACSITDEVFTRILPFVTEGTTELELSEKMNESAVTLGAKIGFPTIVAFGRHSAVPHHMTSDEKLEKNSFVLFDFGIAVDGYLSDMSRTVFFGTPTDEQVKLYDTVKRSQQEAMDYIANNQASDIFVKDVDIAARKVIEQENFPVYPHALGHGVGLDVHEAPTISQYSPEKLLPGMVFTIEPGIYDPSMGGVRIEDVYTIQDNKLLQLTHSSKELIVI